MARPLASWQPRTRRAFIASAMVVVGVPTFACAQDAPPATPPPAEFRWIAPGDSLLRGARVVPGVARFALTAYRDADEFPIGRIQEEVTVDTVGGVPVLRRVVQLQRSGPNGAQRITDSSTTELLTLAPRWHRSEQPNRRITIDFAGRKVRALIGLPDASPAVVDTTVARPPFDSGNWELLLRALPLAPGLRVRFLVYDTDAGIHEYRLAVTGTATIQGEEAHVVTFALSPHERGDGLGE